MHSSAADAITSWLVGHRPTNQSLPRLRPRSRFWGSNPPPPFFPPLREGWSGLGLPVSLFHGVSIRSPTDLVALPGMVLVVDRLLAQTFAVSLVGSPLSRCELCRLVVVIVVADIVVLVCSLQRPWD